MINNVEEKSKVVPIFTSKVAAYLMLNRFILIDVKPNLKNKTKNVYLFKDTPKLREYLGKYSSDEKFKTLVKHFCE